MICRSILHVFLCPPIRLVGLAYFPMPFYLNGVGVLAELLAGMPLYCGHKVADQPRHTLLGRTPLCFTDEVLDHEFPEGFKPVNIEAYDGTTYPRVWIEDYILHIHMARGDDLHAIKYLPLKLKEPARHWLKGLPENSIGSWEELEDTFRENFQGTYVRPPDADDLTHITQQPGESAQKLRNRFLTKKN